MPPTIKKSEAIRLALRDKLAASPAEIAAKLREQGVSVTANKVRQMIAKERVRDQQQMKEAAELLQLALELVLTSDGQAKKCIEIAERIVSRVRDTHGTRR